MKKKIIAIIFIVAGVLMGTYSMIDLHHDVDKYKNYHKIEGEITYVDEKETVITIESEDEGELDKVYSIDNKFYHDIGDKIDIYESNASWCTREYYSFETLCEAVESKFLVFFTDFLGIIISGILVGIGSNFVFNIFTSELSTQLESFCNTKKAKSTKKSN